MKVCYLNYIGGPTINAASHSTIGGLNTILFNLIYNISLNKEIEIEVIFRDDGSPTTGIFKEIRLPVGSAKSIAREEIEKLLPVFTTQAISYIILSQPDLIHTSGSEAGQVMLKLRSMGVNIPWVHTNYATLAVRRFAVDKVNRDDAVKSYISEREKSCLLECDAITALSMSDKEEISEVFCIAAQKIAVIYPGIDTTIFFPDRSLRRNNLLISAGRISKIKDFPFLLKSFSIIRKFSNSAVKLLIIGGNSSERLSLGLLDLVKELGITENVEFIDGVDQNVLAGYFRNATVFIAHSQHETFGLLPIEAQACGLPFVARANSGYLSTSNDGNGGYFCQNDSELDMAEKILRILNMEEDAWLELSVQAEQNAVQYQWSEAAERTLDLYKRIVN